MRVQRIGITKKNRLLLAITNPWKPSLCVFASLLTVALSAGCGEPWAFAQDVSPQTVTDYVSYPDTQARVKPKTTEATTSSVAGKEAPVQPAVASASPGANATEASAATQPAKGLTPAPAPGPTSPKTAVAQQTEALLKLANSLKAEVDKTSKDTLSVTVVREAGEIEKLAHKMRTQ